MNAYHGLCLLRIRSLNCNLRRDGTLKKMLDCNSLESLLFRGFCGGLKNGGGDPGIRTLGGVTLAGFQDRCIRPTLPDLHVSVTLKSGGATRI
jgi:hypothetical protein